MPPMHLGGSTRSLCLLAAIVSLGLALQVNDGLYDALALALLVLCMAATAGSFFVPRKAISNRLLIGSMLSAAFVYFAAAFFRNAGATHSYMPPDSQRPYHAAIFAAALGLVVAVRRPRLVTFVGCYLLAVFVVVGVWKIRSAPHPLIDVYDFQIDGPRALLNGVNPYTITFPNIYGPDTPVYGPSVVQGDRLMFGYPYAPLNLYWALPSVFIFNDPRYAQLLALLLSGAILWRIVGGAVGVMAAALLLFSPRTFYVVESAWTEPLSILLLSLMIWSYLRGSRWTLVLFGLFVASKQYLPITLLLVPTLMARRESDPLSPVRGGEGRGEGEDQLSKTDAWKLITPPPHPNPLPRVRGRGDQTSRILTSVAVVCAVAFVVSAPLIFWNLPAFVRSAITLQLHQPFRDDAMSLLVPIARNWPHRDRAAIIAFLAATGVAVALYRCRTDAVPATARAIAAQLLIFFALNKQAFANYYILVIAALVLALVEEFVQNRATPPDRTLSDYALSPVSDPSARIHGSPLGSAG